MRRHALVIVPLLAGPMALGACRSNTVDLGFRPDVGDRYEYRYEIDAVVTQEVPGAEPGVTELTTELIVEQVVESVSDEGVRVAVELRSEGSAPRSVVVVLDRAGSLEGIELIEGLPGATSAFGAGAGTTAIPRRPLAPGDRWSIGGTSGDGTARLERLGVIDGEDVAVVSSDLTEAVEDASAAAGGTTLSGTRSSESTTSYDLVDGAVRRSSSEAHADLTARIAPPEGVDAEPVEATITYDVQVRVTRIG